MHAGETMREDHVVTTGSGLDARIEAEVAKLDPELRAYVRRSPIGLALQHPLVFQVPVLSAQIANDVLAAKQQQIIEARAQGKHRLSLTLHERAYRLDALVALRDEMSLDALGRDAFSRLAAHVWIDSESIGHQQDTWLRLFDEHIDADAFMRDEDASTLAAMPTDAEGCIEIHRGCDPDSLHGMSWTTDYAQALDFASRLRDEPILLSGRVAKDDVLAYTDARSEAEIIVRPETVLDAESVEL